MDPGNLVESANLFGKMVAGNLLQYDPNDWALLKKKIWDMFYEYETNKSRRQPLNSSLHPLSYPSTQTYLHVHQQQTYSNMISETFYPFSPGSNLSTDSYHRILN